VRETVTLAKPKEQSVTCERETVALAWHRSILVKRLAGFYFEKKSLAGIACKLVGIACKSGRTLHALPGLLGPSRGARTGASPHHLAGRWSWWQPHVVMCRHGRGTGVHGDGGNPIELVVGQARAIELAISLAAQSPCLQFSSSLSAAAPPRVQGKKGHPRYRRPSSGWACLDWIVGRALSARLHACMRRSAVVFDCDELMMISPGPVYRAVCFPSHRVLGRIACLTRICKPKTRYWAVLREVRIRWDLKIIGYVSLIRTIPVQSFCLLK